MTWYHHITILDKIKDLTKRDFYIQKTAENGWSRNVLVHQIEGNLYQRQGKALTNFHQSLPSVQSELVKEIIKDPYKFNFLNMGDRYHEKDVESTLITHITNFLLE